MITNYFTSTNKHRKENTKRQNEESFEEESRKKVKDVFQFLVQDIELRKLKCLSGLDVDYGIVFNLVKANEIYDKLEKEIKYNQISQVKLFGKLLDVPRKQTAFGDDGLKYTFSGTTVNAKPWTPILLELKNCVEHVSKCEFNFVLVNRYSNGQDYIGEHRDDEKDLEKHSPIASISFGQSRDFVFKHKSAKFKVNSSGEKSPEKKVYKLCLEHGSLLLMNYPTNVDWYHGLPKRSMKTCPNPRINLTFRKMLMIKA